MFIVFSDLTQVIFGSGKLVIELSHNTFSVILRLAGFEQCGLRQTDHTDTRPTTGIVLAYTVFLVKNTSSLQPSVRTTAKS